MTARSTAADPQPSPPIPRLGLRHRQRRLGQDLDPGRPGGAAAAARRRPEAILCVTYTKAAAAEMQRRLFERAGRLGGGATTALGRACWRLAEPASATWRCARALFARALETPGGLKIQTIHAFCEKLLRRFPLEAGVSPGLPGAGGRRGASVSGPGARRRGRCRLDDADGPVGRAYAHFSVELDFAALQRHVRRLRGPARGDRRLRRACAGGWRRRRLAPLRLRRAASSRGDRGRGGRRASTGPPGAGARRGPGRRHRATATSSAARRWPADATADFAAVWALFSTPAGEPRASRSATKPVDAGARAWLAAEQARLARRAASRQGGAGSPRHRPRPHPGRGLRRALRGREGRVGGARLRRPDRAHRRAADRPGRRRLGALQARRRHRPRAAGRGAGHRARAVGHPARPDRRVLRRRRAPRRRARPSAPCSRSATRSSRSTPSRARGRNGSPPRPRRYRARIEGAGRPVRQRAAAGELALDAGDPGASSTRCSPTRTPRGRARAASGAPAPPAAARRRASARSTSGRWSESEPAEAVDAWGRRSTPSRRERRARSWRGAIAATIKAMVERRDGVCDKDARAAGRRGSATC